jgi:O-antigen ligase
MALVILSEREPLHALESVLRRAVFILVPFSLLLIKYFPHLGATYGRWSGQLMWVGVASQKNGLGILCFVSGFFLLWRALRAWNNRRHATDKRQVYADLMVLAITFFLLKGPGGAYSATSIIVLVLGLGTLLVMLWIRKKRFPLKVYMLRTVVVLCFAYAFAAPFGAREALSGFLELIGRDPSFTDRDEIWAELIPIAMENPLFGKGYGGFWVRPIESAVNEAHNGYLDVMLELGLIGVLLIFGFVLSMCRAAYSALARSFWWASFGFCLLLMVVVHNTSESTFLKTSDLLWSLVVFLSVLLPVAASERKQRLPMQDMRSKMPTLQTA